MRVPGGVCCTAFSSRLRTIRCRSSRTPGTTAGSAAMDSSWPSASGPSSAAASVTHIGQIGGPLRRRATGVGARQEQQVAHEPAHPARGAQRGLGRVGLLAVELLGQQLQIGQHAGQRGAQLVRGIGDELPLAVEHGLGLAPGTVQRAEHVLEGAARARPPRRWPRVGGPDAGGSRVRSISRAASVSRTTGRMARCGIGQAGQQSQHRPAEHAEQEDELHPGQGLLDVGQGRRVEQHHAARQRRARAAAARPRRSRTACRSRSCPSAAAGRRAWQAASWCP